MNNSYPDVHRRPCPLAEPGGDRSADRCSCTHRPLGHHPTCAALHDVERIAPWLCDCRDRSPAEILAAMRQPGARVDLEEGDRQLVLLALAELALRRPGWDDALGRVADRLGGRDLFARLKTTSADLVRSDEGG